jgi:RNA polymerase sigma-70 factor (ECF subfamily)
VRVTLPTFRSYPAAPFFIHIYFPIRYIQGEVSKLNEKITQNRVFSQGEASKDEENLLRGLRAKENWAYGELIDRYADKLYRLAYRFFPQDEAAQDIVQDVLKKVLEKIDTFKGDSSLYTWLYRVAVNECLMKLRVHKTKKMIAWEEVMPKFESGIIASHEAFADWAKMPDLQVMEQEAREFIAQCIEELPEDYKAAYILKDVEQRSEREVCELLGLNKSVMKVRVHRARMYLRKKLEERYVTHA